MENKDAWMLISVLSFVGLAGIVFNFVEDNATGQAFGGPVNLKSIAKAPYTDLPYNNEPIEMPFAGRCYRDEGDQVVFFTVTHQDVDRVFDGCYQAQDGNNYYYDYYCVGNAQISQVWLRISPGC